MSRWIQTAPTTDTITAPTEDVPDTTPTGPTRPIGTRAPDTVDRLPVNHAAETRNGGRYWYLGAHGGAGETTLAALDPQGKAAGHAWPGTGPGQDVVLTARQTVTGLTALQHALRHWASGAFPQITLLGVITIPAAPGRPPKPVRDLLHRVSGGAPRTWEIGYEPKLHAVLDPTEAPTPGGLNRVTRTLTRLSTEGATP